MRLCYALWQAHHVMGAAADGDVFSVLAQSARRVVPACVITGLSAWREVGAPDVLQ
jgi:hypothetical protein